MDIELYIKYAMEGCNIPFGRRIYNEEELLEFINEAVEKKFKITEVINNTGY